MDVFWVNSLLLGHRVFKIRGKFHLISWKVKNIKKPLASVAWTTTAFSDSLLGNGTVCFKIILCFIKADVLMQVCSILVWKKVKGKCQWKDKRSQYSWQVLFPVAAGAVCSTKRSANLRVAILPSASSIWVSPNNVLKYHSAFSFLNVTLACTGSLILAVTLVHQETVA